MKVVGLDLSLTSTGVAVATPSGAITDRITSAPARKVGKGDPPLTLFERADRLGAIRVAVLDHVRGADLVVVEGPSYGSTTPYQHERSGLWWSLIGELVLGDVEVVEVAPPTRIRYALGKGVGSKDDVLSAVIRRYPHVDVNGNDEADALILAAMGARHLGHPIEPFTLPTGRYKIPAANLAAMDAVHWPNPDRIAG